MARLKPKLRGCTDGNSLSLLGCVFITFVLSLKVWFHSGLLLHLKSASATQDLPLESKAGAMNVMKTDSNVLTSPEKPAVILHIGPPKTGTTTLQWAFVDLAKELERDNFVQPSPIDIPGVWPRHAKLGANLAYCIKGQTKACNPILLNETFPAFVKTVLANPDRPNILLSAEDFHYKSCDVKKLRELLGGFRVKVLKVYRPFHEWLKSWYFEQNRGGGVSIVHWLSHGNLDILIGDADADMEYEALFDEMDVVDMATSKRSNGIVVEVLCNRMFPSTPHACQAAKSWKNQHSDNSAFQIEYYRIIAEAWGQGLIEKPDSPAAAHEKGVAMLPGLITWWEKTKSRPFEDIPHYCPSKGVLDRIVEYSVAYEKRLSKYMKLETTPEDLRVKVHDHLGIFCAVNTTAVLLDSEWREIILKAEADTVLESQMQKAASKPSQASQYH